MILQNNNKCSLLTISTKQFSEQNLLSWIDSKVIKDNNIPIIRITIASDILFKSFLKSTILNSIRKNYDKEIKLNRFLYVEEDPSIENMKQFFNITNHLFGNIALVDNNSHLRWLAEGHSTPLELDQLSKVIDTIIK
jgi:hypothetical protein